jgi:hypothetical protein
VEAGEDVFRFHLIPEYNSDLPKITTSVLKTRSTLSLHKVHKYLIKKLEESSAEELNPDFNTGGSLENQVVIHCNGKELSQSLQLKTAKDLFWPYEDKLLTLHYKRRDVELQ